MLLVGPVESSTSTHTLPGFTTSYSTTEGALLLLTGSPLLLILPATLAGEDMEGETDLEEGDESRLLTLLISFS